MQHTQRIQSVLEEANVKLSSVIAEILGVSGRRILKAIVAGETDPRSCPSSAAHVSRPRALSLQMPYMDACAPIIASSSGSI